MADVGALEAKHFSACQCWMSKRLGSKQEVRHVLRLVAGICSCGRHGGFDGLWNLYESSLFIEQACCSGPTDDRTEDRRKRRKRPRPRARDPRPGLFLDER